MFLLVSSLTNASMHTLSLRYLTSDSAPAPAPWPMPPMPAPAPAPVPPPAQACPSGQCQA